MCTSEGTVSRIAAHFLRNVFPNIQAKCGRSTHLRTYFQVFRVNVEGLPMS